MKSSGREPQRSGRPNRRSASAPWCAVVRHKVRHARPCDWSPRRRSNGNWSPQWGEKRSGFCCCTTTSSRGGKKMWCVADLNDEYIEKMEDVLEVYERPYDAAEPVVC